MRISDWSSDVCSSDLLDQLADGAQCQADRRADGAHRLFGADRHESAAGDRKRRHADAVHAGLRVLACVIASEAKQSRAVLRTLWIAASPRIESGAPRNDDVGISFRRQLPSNAFALRDRKNTRLNSVTNAHPVCRLLLE